MRFQTEQFEQPEPLSFDQKKEKAHRLLQTAQELGRQSAELMLEAQKLMREAMTEELNHERGGRAA